MRLIVKFHFKIHSGIYNAFASIIKAVLIVDTIVPNFISTALTNESWHTSAPKYTMFATPFEIIFELIDIVEKYD